MQSTRNPAAHNSVCLAPPRTAPLALADEHIDVAATVARYRQPPVRGPAAGGGAATRATLATGQ
jgi:trimethylamine:corrinoid methyltransferase-like protein